MLTGHTDTENEDLHVPALAVGTELLQALLESGDGALWAEMELSAPFLQLGLPHVRAEGGERVSLCKKKGVEHGLQGEGPSLRFPILADVARELQQVRVGCHVRGAHNASHGCTSIAGAAKEVEDGDKADEEERERDDKHPLPTEGRETEPDAEEEHGGAEDDVGGLSFGKVRGRCQGVIGRAAHTQAPQHGDMEQEECQSSGCALFFSFFLTLTADSKT